MERLPEGVTIEFFNFLASDVDAPVVKADDYVLKVIDAFKVQVLLLGFCPDKYRLAFVRQMKS